MSLAKKINLSADENIVAIIRRYSITLFWHYFFAAVFMFSAAFFMFWLFAQGTLGYVAFSLAMLIGLFIIGRAWFFSAKNLLVITTWRIVDVNRRGWLDEVVSAVGLSDIKDIFFRKKGLWAGLLNYGDLTVETKSEHTQLVAVKIHAPQKWQGVITDVRENFKTAKHLSNRQAIYSAFVKIIPDLTEPEICEVKDLLDNSLMNLDRLDSDEE
ncbi:MAG: hypothetical protein Q7S66_02950 [bacterium]|nr:hypothetical protein [bacterium]